QQETVFVTVQRNPVYLREGGLVRCVPPASGHDPELAALPAHGADRVNVVPDVWSTVRAPVLRDVLDHAGVRPWRSQVIEGLQSRCLQVEVHEQDFPAHLRKLSDNINESHRAADTALERVEGDDLQD